MARSDSLKIKRDAAVIGTNNSSIVSKRSVEKLYSKTNEHQFLRYFVRKPQSRSPLINRGYWLRMHAVEYVVNSFLEEKLLSPKRKVVVNLGCGYDPLPFQYLSKQVPDKDVLFVDIDYPDLISIKASIVADQETLHSLLTEAQHFQNPKDYVHYKSAQYMALGIDLRSLNTLKEVFGCHGIRDVAILFTAEVSLTYMDREAVDSLIQWAASLPDARFSILEQFLPEGPTHPFARTMLKHFNSLNTPLKSVFDYTRLRDQAERYASRGWKSVDACDLLAFWTRIPQEERDRIEQIEPFDEWEEFFLFCQHYFILYAHNNIGATGPFQEEDIKATGGTTVRLPERLGTVRRHSTDEYKPPGVGGFQANFTPHRLMRRRSGAAAAYSVDSLVYQGGQGPKSRMNTSLLATSHEDTDGFVKSLSGPTARVCHTMTTLAPGTVLLVGGRTSPRKPCKDVFLLENGVWRKVQDLPSGRYRHGAAAIDDKRVMVYGGLGEGGKVLDEWLLWSEERGWQVFKNESDPKPPARFSAGFCWTDGDFGILAGGMGEKGRVLDDLWRVRFTYDPTTGKGSLTTVWSMLNIMHMSRRAMWSRFGGQLVYIGNARAMLVGGVSGHGLMRAEETVLEFHCEKISISAIRSDFPTMKSPLLIGHSVVCLDDKMVISGGGGVCFSFGSCFTEGVWTLSECEKSDTWYIIEEGLGLVKGDEDNSALINSTMTKADDLEGHADALEVTKVHISTREEFENIMEQGIPVLMEGLDIGNCVHSWTSEYLKQSIGPERQVVVHAAKSSAMSFQRKNFDYKAMSFGQFIDEVYASGSRLYFRSLSAAGPTSAPTNLFTDFPGIAQDFSIPAVLAPVSENLHSAPLRISSADVGMWVHYDVTANILAHVRGRKLFRLYPPSDITKLSFPAGASTSTVLDIFSTPSPPGTTPIDVELTPGDVLYIPPLWLHAAKPLTPCVAVNVFFRNLSADSYANGKDVYGNRDLAVYDRGRAQVAKIVRDFKGLPEAVKRFYLERLAEELKDGAKA